MKVSFIAVYHLHGAAHFAEGAAAGQIFEAQGITATLTSDPTPALEHIFRASALVRLLLTAFTGTSGQTPQQVLDAAVAASKGEHAKKFKRGLFIVFEAEHDVENVDLNATAEVADYGVALEAIDKVELRSKLDPTIEGVITAVVSSLPPNADTRVTKVGEAAFLDLEKPTYAMSMRMGSATLSVSSPVDAGMLTRTATLASDLANDARLIRAVHLHSIGANAETDRLLAFLAAWAALEVFANATFKDHYNDEWYAMLVAAAPPAAKGVVGRLEEVMKDKLRLVDKFSVIASILDPTGASGDIDKFSEIKKVRDEFFHALQGGDSGFPTEATLSLFRKYLRLHVAHKRPNR